MKSFVLLTLLCAGTYLAGCVEASPEGADLSDDGEWYESELTPAAEEFQPADGPRGFGDSDQARENTDFVRPLPAWETPEEKEARDNLLFPRAGRSSSPPVGNVYVPAEYARMEGVLVQIPLDNYSSNTWNYFGAIVEGVTETGARAYILEPNSRYADYVLNNILKPRGIDTSLVNFLYMRNDAFWSRDYGPWHIYVNGKRAIVNQSYYAARANDDAVPLNLGREWDEDVYSTGFYTEGGNFMTDGRGVCFASTGIFSRNNLSRGEAERIYREYLGCEAIYFVAPLYGEGTTHIDMFSKIVSEDTILVGYSNSGLGANTNEMVSLEDAADFYANIRRADGGRFQIVRIPMTFGYKNGYRVFYSHTNALIVNNTVLVPTYARGTDSDALAIYRQTMPGYKVMGIDSNSTIPSGGAIHCTTMQVPMPLYATCGNGVIDSGEECDFYLDGATCESLGLGEGELQCSASCRYETSACNTTVPPTSEKATAVKTGTVVKDDYEYIKVESTDGLTAELSGTGDADLYVWNRASGLTWSNYDCRPYLDGSEELCELDGSGTYYVLVRGYASTSDYQLTVTYTE